MMITLYHV